MIFRFSFWNYISAGGLLVLLLTILATLMSFSIDPIEMSGVFFDLENVIGTPPRDDNPPSNEKRFLAVSESLPVCLPDRIESLDWVRSERVRYESLDPTNVLRFVKKIGSYYPNVQIEQASRECRTEDSVCWVNVLFRAKPLSPIAEEAFVLSFYRTGLMIAGKKAPVGNVAESDEVNSKVWPDGEYLFGSQHIMEMLRFSYRVPQSYFSATHFEAIFLNPAEPVVGERFNIGYATGPTHEFLFYNSSSVEQVEFTKTVSPSYIELLPKRIEKTSDLFGAVLAHEIAHNLDFDVLRTLDTPIRFSESLDWTKLGGFKLVFSTDESAKNILSKWVAVEELAQEFRFVSEYASTSPKEDFAETAEVAIWAPAKLADVPKHSDYIRNALLDAKAFDSESLRTRYQFWIARSMILSGLSGVTEQCGELKLNSNCYRNFMSEQYERSLVYLYGSDYEACSEVEGASKKLLKQVVLFQMDELLSKLTPFSIGEASEAFWRLRSNWDLREVAAVCSTTSNPAECFDKEKERSYRLSVEKFPSRIQPFLQAAAPLMMEDANYRRNYFRAFSLVGKYAERLRAVGFYEGRDLFESCERQIRNGSTFESQDGPIRLGSNYVSSAFLNCVNLNLPKRFFQKLSGDWLPLVKGINMEKVSPLLFRAMVPFFSSYMNSYAKNKADQETKVFEDFHPDALKLAKHWLSENYVSDQTDCRNRYREAFSHVLRNDVNRGERTSVFVPKKKWLEAWSLKECSNAKG